MKIYFVTKNKHKLDEANAIFSEYGIEVEQIAEEKNEPKEMNLEEVSTMNAKEFHGRYKKPIIVDDTGVFFKAYEEFPGNHPKLMFNLLGYKGLLKLVENESRDAEFRTVVAYCDEDNLKVFSGELECTISEEVHDEDKDVLPYERIFIHDGKLVSSMSREDKNKISHRAKAFRNLAEWLKQQDSNNE